MRKFLKNVASLKCQNLDRLSIHMMLINTKIIHKSLICNWAMVEFNFLVGKFLCVFGFKRGVRMSRIANEDKLK